jgi:hypothetical protein
MFYEQDSPKAVCLCATSFLCVVSCLSNLVPLQVIVVTKCMDSSFVHVSNAHISYASL